MENCAIRRLHQALPAIRQWIEELLRQHAEQAQPVGTLDYPGLSRSFSKDLLNQTKFVMVPKVPFPPVDQFGMPELAAMQSIPMAGITFKDTYFIQQNQASENLHFHELVHAVQWKRLGVNNFLLAYGVGLQEFGYEASPLEQMAYALQYRFEQGVAMNDLEHFINMSTDKIWSEVAQSLNFIK